MTRAKTALPGTPMPKYGSKKRSHVKEKRSHAKLTFSRRNARPTKPKSGWDSTTTSEALRYAEAMVLGRKKVLHHPHCPSLRPQHSTCYYSHVCAVPADYGIEKGYKKAIPGADRCCGHYMEMMEPRIIH